MSGTIRTGADRRRIPGAFVPVLDAAVDQVAALGDDISVYVYGSVATGQAHIGRSDVDLLTVELPADLAADVGRELSSRFSDVCRGVEIATSAAADYDRDGDEAYGGRIFLHHYCVHLAGPDRDRATTDFAGDVRAARAFNGDIDRHARRWRQAIGTTDPAELAHRIARKTLLAVAGLVSVHDGSWTTDREVAARRWPEIEPTLADPLARLVHWATRDARPGARSVATMLDVAVDPIVSRFESDIGLWHDGS